jgi:hypothetical protein
MTSSRALSLSLTFVLSACTVADPCVGLSCGACPDTFVVRVTLEGGGTEATIDGDPCVPDGATFVCSARPGVGESTVLVEAPGFASSMESVVVEPPPAGCCMCSPTVTRSITLSRGGTSDAGLDAM